MQITLPVTEAIALAVAKEPLPPVVRSVTAAGTSLLFDIDLRVIPDAPFALRVAAAAAGTVAVTATFAGFTLGVATFEIAVHARALPAHKLLNHLTGPLAAALTRRGLPAGLVEIRKGDGEPVLAVHVQAAVATMVTGVTVTDLDLRDATAYLTLAVGNVTLRQPLTV